MTRLEIETVSAYALAIPAIMWLAYEFELVRQFLAALIMIWGPLVLLAAWADR